MTLEQILAIHAIDAKLAERLAEQHRWHEQYICHVYGITTDDYWEVVRLSDGKPVVAHQLAIAELLMGVDVEFTHVGLGNEYCVRAANSLGEIFFYHSGMARGAAWLHPHRTQAEVLPLMRSPRLLSDIDNEPYISAMEEQTAFIVS